VTGEDITKWPGTSEARATFKGCIGLAKAVRRTGSIIQFVEKYSFTCLVFSLDLRISASLKVGTGQFLPEMNGVRFPNSGILG
jgi:hypothetical protein